MKTCSRYITAALVGITLSITAQAASSYFKFLNVTVQLADSTAAAQFLSVEDAYLSSMSAFDYAGRFKDNKTHTVQGYLQFAAQQTHSWTNTEREQVKAGFTSIENFINTNNLHLSLPDTIVFIQSTCKEEFEAGGYTRRNGIVLKDGEVISSGLIAHELFHVLTRNSPALRDELYANIGFNKCNSIDVSKVMGGLNITNPDCPVISHYIHMGTEDLVLVLHSKKPYEGGSIFSDDYIAISLIPIRSGDNDKKPVMRDGKPLLYGFEDKLEILEQIGTNTDYVLHPEEICAEHFAALVTEREVPQPEFLDKMKEKLK